MRIEKTLCDLFGHKISNVQWAMWKIKNNPINVKRHGYSSLTCPRCGYIWNPKEGDLKKIEFTIGQHNKEDEQLSIIPPSSLDIEISINFDDVDRSEVNKISKKIVKILNDNLEQFT